MMFLEFLNSHATLCAAVIFLIFSIPISICDIRSLKIPDLLNILLAVLLLAYRLIFSRNDVFIYCICSVLAFLLFWLVRRISKLGLGWGDIKYSPSCALVCGNLCFPGFLLSSVFCALYFLIVKMTNRSNKAQKAPFAPFMALGTLSLSSIPIVQELLN